MQTPPCLDFVLPKPQTRFMPNIYISCDFGADEEKAQQARHKLDVWKQAFRLDKKLLCKFDRDETGAASDGAKNPKSEQPANSTAKSKPAKDAPAPTGTVKLLLRLGFSAHEKISEHRWLERIPSEEPFKSASPRIIKAGQPDFAATEHRFDNLEKSYGFMGGTQQHPG
jgi:hypothetical protein